MSSITKSLWSNKDGKDVFLFTLTNARHTTVQITNHGGVIVSILVPDRNGKMDDVTLGLKDADSYLTQNHPYFGPLVGRCANRIYKGRMKVGGKDYQLAVGKKSGNHLHGGAAGFDKKVWQPEITVCEDGDCLELSYFSKDGEENYPGNLDVKVRYSLSEDNSLKIFYFAQTDAETVVNLTNHAYFNLSGHASGDILKHELKLYASRFTPVVENGVPTEEIRDVAGTSMDFTASRPIGQGIDKMDEQLAFCGGYDHNWVLDNAGAFPGKAAEVYDPASGRAMEVFTTMPGIQLYTANILNVPSVGVRDLKGGAAYGKYSGFCLDTQYFPDAVNHPNFPSPILKPGEKYNHTTIYKFSVRA